MAGFEAPGDTQVEGDSPLPPPTPTAIQSESIPPTGVPCRKLDYDVSVPQLSRSLRRSRALLLLGLAAGAAAMFLLGIALDRYVLPHDSTGDRIDERTRNVLVNGSFEEGPVIPRFGGAFNQLEIGSVAVTGWVVSRGNVNVVDSAYWTAAKGRRSLDLNGSMPGAVSQTFNTKKGQKYRVTFALAGSTPNVEPKVKNLQIRAGGQATEFTFDTAGKTHQDMGWVRKTWEFTAGADKTTLEFLSLTDGHAGPALDDVVVVIRD